MTGEILSLETAEKLKKLEKAIKYIKDTCWYPELENYSNMTDYEVKELIKILED